MLKTAWEAEWLLASEGELNSVIIIIIIISVDIAICGLNGRV
jgi:hypothetical protein